MIYYDEYIIVYDVSILVYDLRWINRSLWYESIKKSIVLQTKAMSSMDLTNTMEKTSP